MSEACKETLCTSCIHLPICKLKETYLKAQEAIDQTFICEECLNDEGKPATKMTYIANLRDWLTIPTLQCKYYRKEVATR